MLALLTSLVVLGRVSAQDLPTPEQRRAEIVRLVLEYGKSHTRFFSEPNRSDTPDPGTILIRDSSDRPSYADGSLEYAAAALMSGQDTEHAQAIVDCVLGAQATGGKVAGAFPWRPGEEPDAYATAYLAPWLVYLHQHLADALPEATRTRLASALRPALAAVGRFNPQSSETAACLDKMAALTTLASALGDSGAAARAASDFAVWLKSTNATGFPILQQPTPMVESVAALHWIWLAAPNDTAKRGAAGALEYLYRDLALRCLPTSGVVGGAVVSGHYGDYAAGTSATRYLLYAQFGRPQLAAAEPFAMFLVVPGFTPTAETAALARAVEAPRTIRCQSGERRLTTYVHPRYALGTLSGPVESRTTPVVITYGPAGEPGAFCRVRPTPCRVAALQQEGCALVSFDFDQVGFDDGRQQVDLQFHLGPKSALDSVLVNQTPYTVNYAAAVETRSAVITERDGVYTAVTPITMGPIDEKPWDATPQPGNLKWDTTQSAEDPWLVLTLPARWLEAREQSRDNFRVALAVEVGSRDDYPDVAAFAKAVYEERRVKQDASLKHVKVGERNERMNQDVGVRRPVERGDWIIETQVLQNLTFTTKTDVLQLNEDLEQNRVVSESVNAVSVLWDFLYRSLSLNQVKGDALDACLRPPPPPPAPPEPKTPPAKTP